MTHKVVIRLTVQVTMTEDQLMEYVKDHGIDYRVNTPPYYAVARHICDWIGADARNSVLGDYAEIEARSPYHSRRQK